MFSYSTFVKLQGMAESSKTKKLCPDCGSTPVNHFSAKATIALGFLIKIMTLPLARAEDVVADFLLPKIELLLPSLFKTLAFIGLGRIAEEPAEDNIARTKYMWRAAKERGIKVRQFRVFNRPTIIFWAEWGGKRIVFEGLPRPLGVSRKPLEWMDNKALMKKQFQAGGIPVAKGGVALTKRGALKIFRRLAKPVIAKPHLGSRSRHTTTHIKTEAELLKAFRSARMLSPWVIIEEELKGFVFRVTLIGGKLAGALRREPPSVVGNGASSVRALVEKENQNPKRQEPPFHEIALGAEAERELARQDLALESVPEKGRFVALGQKVGRGEGGSNTEMLREVHPENVLLFEKLARVVGDPLIGVDFIMRDIRRPWREQELVGTIELNSLPFLDLHHEPLRGEPTDPSGALWDIVFSEATDRR